MRSIICILISIGGLVLPIFSEEIAITKSSERGKMVKRLILEEAPTQGYSGDSIKLDFDVPCSVVMRLYSVSNGESTVVQASHLTVASKNFEIGFLLHPEKDGARTLSFLFYNHERPTKGHADLANQEQKPDLITKNYYASWFTMGSVRTTGESVVFFTTPDKGIITGTDTVESTAQGVESGYVITAMIDTVESIAEGVETGYLIPATNDTRREHDGGLKGLQP